jgi:hypothetical protein
MKNIFQIQIYSLTCLLSQNFQLLNSSNKKFDLLIQRSGVLNSWVFLTK